MSIKNLKFDEKGLIPAIIQDAETKEVLMMAYMNEESLKNTIRTGRTCFWSRSRQELWWKGETSGHIQEVVEIDYDCDGDTLLLKVNQSGGACHTGHKSCFYRGIKREKDAEKVFDPKEVYKKSLDSDILDELYEVIKDRKENPKEGSYTSSLYKKGENSFLKKIGEEATEVVMAAKEKDQGEIIYEVADLVYHLMVMMVYYGVDLKEIYQELEDRR
ncbi:phosphoribosyl-ATP pyrophosphatase /phosphoribosyl-AMP cyclohydrolase [Orenia metallireducens]|jgi:phosphoribosyl-ATP pyrophosphohydrolase/phosphoribosyl-AMP cyclohydrolase|uniref:Histidine biosynthesis bifunctional protein HisIE n=1 Tax=Orenia metallireducens TaxID=1413210 RepID=A0A285GPK6_9FIRM|nr:bifunctional phosphoribosyl-AMP cyclohydrolase/phosphoribosyl-ATP diphosphatase HisIE [Orenia metallireducens]PRX29899.1 phosphoribosyl-ATP pyrophosphatase /phosphoribosyl-AMP cyclohydrolase [Orenia metallireducens]SNY25560.1 phosphoribosyl-ATP pyrophosphatase /phosphoribosyl-AMP cyclohydrolase [Orenia metallireducens]